MVVDAAFVGREWLLALHGETEVACLLFREKLERVLGFLIGCGFGFVFSKPGHLFGRLTGTFTEYDGLLEL